MVKTWNPHSLSKSKSFLKVRARRFFPLWFNMNLDSHWKMSGPSHERNHCHPSLHVQSPQTSPPRQRRVTAKFLLQLCGGRTSEIFPLKFLQIFEFGWGGQEHDPRGRDIDSSRYHVGQTIYSLPSSRTDVLSWCLQGPSGSTGWIMNCWLNVFESPDGLQAKGEKKTPKCPFGMWWVKV